MRIRLDHTAAKPWEIYYVSLVFQNGFNDRTIYLNLFLHLFIPLKLLIQRLIPPQRLACHGILLVQRIQFRLEKRENQHIWQRKAIHLFDIYLLLLIDTENRDTKTNIFQPLIPGLLGL